MACQEKSPLLSNGQVAAGVLCPVLGPTSMEERLGRLLILGVRIIKIAREAEGQNDGPREEGSVALFILEKKKIKGGSYK